MVFSVFRGISAGGSSLIIHFPTLMAYSARPGCSVTFAVGEGEGWLRPPLLRLLPALDMGGWDPIEERPRGRRVTRYTLRMS